MKLSEHWTLKTLEATRQRISSLETQILYRRKRPEYEPLGRCYHNCLFFNGSRAIHWPVTFVLLETLSLKGIFAS